MTGALLLAALLGVVVALLVWRRARLPPERRPQPQRRSSAMRVEAYVFPLIGAVLVGATLFDWAGTISLVFLGLGLPFLLTGVTSFLDLRRRAGASTAAPPDQSRRAGPL